MCGIAGVVALNGSDPEPGLAGRMRDRIIHRGPDGKGEFDATGVSLAACRLAIVDLDKHGLMPMSSPDGRYRIVHNGEIYNRPELRAELERAGIQLRTTTDTEVLVYLYALYGAAMLDRLDGMFAFAIWDTQQRELFAARDRVGEKPFFYAEHEGRLFFASEPKALFAGGVSAVFRRDDVVGAADVQEHCGPADAVRWRQETSPRRVAAGEPERPEHGPVVDLPDHAGCGRSA